MKKLEQKIRMFNALRIFLCVLIGLSAFHALLIAGASDANRISLKEVMSRVFLCALVILGSLWVLESTKKKLKIMNGRIRRIRKSLQSVNLFSMNVSELSEHFYKTGNEDVETMRSGRVIGTFEWITGSIGDNFRKWAVSNGIPIINTYSGKIWFSDDGATWKSVDFEVSNNSVVRVHERVVRPLQKNTNMTVIGGLS